jgi:NitT/TauT family transport system ATP-binding protein
LVIGKEEKMLLLEHASLGYKTKKDMKTVVKDLNLGIEDGECLALLGPSGCGKSTLINALAGILPFLSGGAFIDKEGQRTVLSPKTHRIGIIPQGSGLLPWKTVRENCLLPLKIKKETEVGQYNKELDEIGEALHISNLWSRFPGEISGGQAQRTAIARAFLLKPELLLMDEPFSSLDAITGDEAKELYLALWEKYRPTVFLVTHNIEEALYLGNKIAVMDTDNGNIKHLEDNPYFGQIIREQTELSLKKESLRQLLQF